MLIITIQDSTGNSKLDNIVNAGKDVPRMGILSSIAHVWVVSSAVLFLFIVSIWGSSRIPYSINSADMYISVTATYLFRDKPPLIVSLSRLPTTFVKAVATSGLIFDKTVDDEKGDDELVHN